jgi:serine/threonine protein kinase
MKPERWQQIERLYHAALERAPEKRAAFLNKACVEDQTLRQEVESLLAFDEPTQRLIAEPLDALVAELLASEQTQSLLGQSLAHYQILARLGRGGMGEVYLAQDTRLGRKVAVKLLPAEFTRDADRVRRFEQEARAASALNHPNIITIHEIGEVEHTRYIVTEYIEGETLREQMRRGRLSLMAALGVARQAAGALAAAHEAGIVHRDIKPENVMLRPDGLVKVLDFGLAKLTERLALPYNSQASTVVRHSTAAGVLLGTPRYMSPEQARGQKVDAATDIFSLGAVLYELLTGRAPFEGSTPSDLIAAILMNEPAPLAHYLPEAPPELERIVSKALRKEREERYQRAQDLLLDLKELEQELEIEARLLSQQQAAAGDKPASARVEANPARAGSSKVRRHFRTAGAVAAALALTGSLIFLIRNNSANESGSRAAPPVASPARLIAAEPVLALPREETYLEMFYDPQRGHLEFTFPFTIKPTGNGSYVIAAIEGKLEPSPASANPLHFSSVGSRLLEKEERSSPPLANVDPPAIPFTIATGSERVMICSLVFPLTDPLLEEIGRENERSLVAQFHGEAGRIFMLKLCFYITNEFQQPHKQFRKRFRGTMCLKDQR